MIAEDLACLGAGILVGDYLTLTDAIVGCVAGTILGDLAWYLVGRCARRFHLWHRFPFRWSLTNDVKRMKELIRTRAVPLVVASRFVPGMRTVVLVAIGGSGAPLNPLLLPAFLAAFAYTTILIVLGWQVGASVEPLLRNYIHGSWWIAVVILIVFALFLVLRQLVVRPTIERFLKLQLQTNESVATSDMGDVAVQAGEAQVEERSQHDHSPSELP